LKFKRQYPIGGFIVDFYCLERKLVIELDGSEHAEQVAYDERRTRLLAAKGFRVVRFWNNDVLTNMEGVLQAIVGAAEEAAPSPARR
jgi:very-short-patch-repair endonuclease